MHKCLLMHFPEEAELRHSKLDTRKNPSHFGRVMICLGFDEVSVGI